MFRTFREYNQLFLNQSVNQLLFHFESLLYPKEIFDLPEIGYLDRLQLKFKLHTDLNSDAKKNLIVHQAFIRFHHTTTNQEIIFIAEIDSNDHYKIDLNLQTRSKEFNDLSGIYQVDLIVGDALLMEPLKWTIGKIPMKLGSISTSLEDVAVVAKEYQPKPEINHIFREQEKRPHALVSNFFTFLVLVPLITLFIAVIIFLNECILFEQSSNYFYSNTYHFSSGSRLVLICPITDSIYLRYCFIQV